MEKCISCDEPFTDERLQCDMNDKVCESCYSDDYNEPCVWVHHLLELNDKYSQKIGHYFNETNGEFELTYVKTDGWRGHYDVTSKNYTKVHNDCALSMSEDEQNLKQFDELLVSLAKKHKIGIVRVCNRTSNVFSLGVNYWVHNTHMEKYNRIVDKINVVKNDLRNEDEFNRTAIFGE